MEIIFCLAFLSCVVGLLIPSAKSDTITSEDLLGSAKTRDSAKQILEKLEKENKFYYELLLIQSVAKYYINNPQSTLGKTLYNAITEHRKQQESELETTTRPTGNYEN
jgi:tRNA A22 N-methylase